MNNYLVIAGFTPVGIATEQALALNSGGVEGSLVTRYDDIMVGRYPPHWARHWHV